MCLDGLHGDRIREWTDDQGVEPQRDPRTRKRRRRPSAKQQLNQTVSLAFYFVQSLFQMLLLLLLTRLPELYMLLTLLIASHVEYKRVRKSSTVSGHSEIVNIQIKSKQDACH